MLTSSKSSGSVGDLSSSTVVVVAHRVSGIREFDRVVVLDGGGG